MYVMAQVAVTSKAGEEDISLENCSEGHSLERVHTKKMQTAPVFLMFVNWAEGRPAQDSRVARKNFRLSRKKR